MLSRSCTDGHRHETKDAKNFIFQPSKVANHIPSGVACAAEWCAFACSLSVGG